MYASSQAQKATDYILNIKEIEKEIEPIEKEIETSVVTNSEKNLVNEEKITEREKGLKETREKSEDKSIEITR